MKTTSLNPLSHSLLLLLFVVLDLITSLHQCTTVAAAGHDGIVGSGSINAVHLPGLGPQHHHRDAGGDAAKQEVEHSTLTKLLRSAVH